MARYAGGRHSTRQNPKSEDTTGTRTARDMMLGSDFPTRSATCRRNEPPWLAPPDIQLSYETNPFRSHGSDAVFAPRWR
jgi:hypothetical protein